MSAAVIWSEDFLSYRWAHSHPMNPVRLALTMSLARSLGVLDDVDLADPLQIDDDALIPVHSRDYIDAVRAVGSGTASLSGPLLARLFGLGDADNPVFDGMHEAARLLVGGTLAAAQAVASGSVRRAVNIGGGMHHAMRSRAAGFCIYNDCSVAIRWLLDHGYDRIAYIDIDAHHGDGVQAEFVADPRVMTISLHQHPATLWPGTGWPTEIGEEDAHGTAVNLPFMPNTPDRLWLRGFHAVVPSMIAEFAPQILISQCGADSHRADPLTDLALTVDGQRAAMIAMRDLAEKYCEGRWIAVGGGGYGVVNVVPRSWTHLLGVVLDRDIPVETTIGEQWCETATEVAGTIYSEYSAAPVGTMSDDGDVGYVAWDGDTGQEAPPGIDESALRQTDRAIMATRKAVFPLHGLDPEDPRD
ncbi:putative acetoin dehydrogenase [Gordonia polyisoprenivorans VH2]|uniref:Acetoin utilization protein AcuC n=2 Tax=Gordonia polyisoprenivorans TaxID=84595 RepID=H6MZS0_GORPV|nr:acetoin utilization protein AcuC [Gordonia polyisoprenivorans]AFA73171.1 putative acetoin dehydrogenase [Gordonia polyisoprenivorans VH2]NKY02777.1 acetoin utilization protein AcuC [Gordonia polyisoprenivorans]OZC34078.1 acetoin utilization protein AcuC [Gordonia polyisoprenivorans]QUD85312.1 acetoin utilization protein AcuC [Gordonia polyisoprenivorans]UZF58621.1 acetoin utilization protein AcuC [Gordonia polyisoprenivorans]